MPPKPTAKAGTIADLTRQLEQAQQEAAYYRDIAREGGKSHLRNMCQLSGLVSELRDAEQRLRESEERYRCVVENLSVGLTITVDRKIVFANAAVATSLGRSLSEIVSNTDPFDYIHPEDRAMVLERHLKRVMGEPVTETYCFRALTKSGEPRWAEATGVRIDWRGRPAVLNFFVDITERVLSQENQKKLERQLVRAQKMEALGAMAGGIAHDFNNRMAAVLAYVSLVRHETDPSHPHHEYLSNAEKQIRGGSQLTKQLLGYARKQPYQVAPIALNTVLTEVAETFGRTHKAIRVHLELHPGPCTVNADRSQIEQALLNLFVNASDAMPNGGSLHLTTRYTSHEAMPIDKFQQKPATYVELQVVDSGVGMSAETMDRIFDPFFTTKPPGRGTGLGLASVFSVVKGHSGYIDVASRPGQGTTFTLYFPAVHQDPVEPREDCRDILTVKGSALVVDDEPIVLETSARMLAKLGFTVCHAGGGREAIEIFGKKTHELDLVVLDMVMPDIGGEEVYQRIKEMRPDARVLIASGFDPSGRVTEVLNRNRDSFLRKPFSLEELSEKVQELLHKD